MPGFQSTTSGFRVTFQNGWTVSIQYGSDNYCQRGYSSENDYFSGRAPGKSDLAQCPDAECAVWDASDTWHCPVSLQPGGDVAGWQTPDDVAALMARVAALPVCECAS